MLSGLGTAGQSFQPLAVGAAARLPAQYADSCDRRLCLATAAGRNWKMQKPMPLLLHADDLAILSTRLEELRHMLDALQEYSKRGASWGS